jgi:poly-gamma-glutamate synthesis protein (capsule biosynthesis protein)
MGTKLSLLAAGELILNMTEDECKEPDYYFEAVKPTFEAADLVLAHLESPHTDRIANRNVGVTQVPPMRNLEGVKYAGIDALTMASNATNMAGAVGIEDTKNWAKENGISTVGAGLNIDEAREPLIMERDGVKFGFLSYDCVSSGSAAGLNKSGAPYVDIITYHHSASFPGSAPRTMTFIERWSLEAMREDIRALRPLCDVLTVAIHQGLGFDTTLADYEYELPHHAIEAGADLIIANHSHVVKATHFYKGVPVFHSTGNLVCVFPWQMHSMFRIDPETTLGKSKIRPRATGHYLHIMDWDAPNYPFPSKEAIIGKLIIDTDMKKIEEVRILPVFMNNEGQPNIHGNDDKGQLVFDTLVKTTQEAGLNSKYKWDGDEIVVYYED